MRLLLLGTASLLLLAGCSTSTSPAATVTPSSPPTTATTSSAAPVATPSATTTTRPTPANPVGIMRKIEGCVIPPGVVSGSVDINGNRYADCTLHPGDATREVAITVRTYPGDPKQLDPNPSALASTDTTKFIVGPTFVVMLTPATGANISDSGLSYMAQDVGGTVVPAMP